MGTDTSPNPEHPHVSHAPRQGYGYDPNMMYQQQQMWQQQQQAYMAQQWLGDRTCRQRIKQSSVRHAAAPGKQEHFA